MTVAYRKFYCTIITIIIKKINNNNRDHNHNNSNRKVRLMKPTHDSLLLRVSCLRTHQTVFNKENSYHLVYIQASEKLLLFA